MKKKKTYFDFLSDPRWQQKKTEILQRDNFTCQHCGRQDRTLHVHHLLYNKDAKPWEYDNKHLITLCEICHENDTEESRESYALFLEAKRKFEEVGFSHVVFNDILRRLSYYFNCINDSEEDIIEEDKKKISSILEDVILGTQSASDLRTLYKLGLSKNVVENFFTHIYCNLTIE